jgi:hypothetical protein
MAASSRVAHLDMQALAKGGKCRLDLIQTGAMPKGEQPVDMRLLVCPRGVPVLPSSGPTSEKRCRGRL